MPDPVRSHYELYPYPRYPLLASIRRCDGYAINLTALWAAFNGEMPPAAVRRILVAGCGSFAPYPFAAANPDSEITALDLSEASLRRARLHCLLHGHGNVRFQAGDLMDAAAAPGPFGLIDAYGVIHHLDDPLSGLTSLRARLAAGGIMRVMVYSRYARREEESIRRALRILGIRTPEGVRRLAGRAAEDSRLSRYLSSSFEAGFDAGLADALLHPRVRTYRIDELLELIDQSGLKLLRFAHGGALEDVGSEVERIRQLERQRCSPGNFLFYLGDSNKGRCTNLRESRLFLNPCLSGVAGCLQLRGAAVAPQLGIANPRLGWRECLFLRPFRTPVPYCTLSAESQAAAAEYMKALFLIPCRDT